MHIRLLGVLLASALGLGACAGADPSPETLVQAHSAIAAPISASAPATSSAKQQTPSALTLSCGEETVSLTAGGDVKSVQITVLDALPSVEDARVSVEITKDGEMLFQDFASQLDAFVPPQNGTYLYRLTDAEGEVYQLEAQVQLPVEIAFSDTKVTLGETLVLYARNAQDMAVTAQSTLPFQPVFYDIQGDKLAFLPVAYTTAPGSYTLDISAGEQRFHYTISVQDREFEVQNLTVDAQTTQNTANNQKANDEWTQKIEPLKKIAEPVKYWEGTFLQPVQGEVTTEFGVIRYTNGSKNATRHSGVDFAAKTGTPVAAANNGVIQFAGFLQLTGNTVVIEHGFGLKSFYYHMDSTTVQTGDTVAKGDQVGTVGSTGFSTGPHLHYSLLVNDIFINPWTAFEKGIA